MLSFLFKRQASLVEVISLYYFGFLAARGHVFWGFFIFLVAYFGSIAVQVLILDRRK